MQSDCSEQKLCDFVKSLGFSDFSMSLIQTAFTHSSFTKEHELSYFECYERLEFLGDAVLKMAVTDYLFEHYPEAHEGELTKIRSVAVSDEILHKVAQQLGIEEFIRLSSAEEKCGGRKLESIQACVMEALFGALYLSSDKEILKTFIIKKLQPFINDIFENKTVYNAKALLQEYTQGKTKDLPVYKIIKESGEPHNKIFSVQVSYKDKILAQAEGKTKKQAQQKAAFKACKALGIIQQDKEEESCNE